MALSAARTINVRRSEWITSALNHTAFAGFCFTTTGVLVSVEIGVRAGSATTCARADGAPTASTAGAKNNAATICLQFFIEGYLQRLQKFYILRGDLHLRLDRFFFHDFIIYAYVQRLQKTPVLRRHLRVLRRTPRQTNRRVQLQHNVESRRTYSRYRFRDPVRVGHRIINGVSQLSQTLLHRVVELQGHHLL